MADTTANDRPPAPIVGPELFWRQPELFKQVFELQVVGVPAARLSWPNRAETQATVVTGLRDLLIDRAGGLRHRTVVREGERDIGTIDTGIGGDGLLVAESGTTYRWRSANVWRSSWLWEDLDGYRLVTITSLRGFLRKEGRVTVTEAGETCQDLTLLCLLGWYLFVLGIRDHRKLV